MKEKLRREVIDEEVIPSYYDHDMFLPSGSFAYFNKESILRNTLKGITEDYIKTFLEDKSTLIIAELIFQERYEGLKKLMYSENHESRNFMAESKKKSHNGEHIGFSPLFRLMSILPYKLACQCKKVMDKDQFFWKLRICDIIVVFFNWGMTPSSLGLEEMSTLEQFKSIDKSCCVSDMDAREIPNHKNVRLVLQSIGERLPDNNNMNDCQRILLLRMLIFVSMDKTQRCNHNYFFDTIIKVMNSFSDWDQMKAEKVAKELYLAELRPHNAVYVCISMLNYMSERLDLTGLYAAHQLLNTYFKWPYEISFISVIDHLPTQYELNELTLGDLSIMVKLVHYLMLKYAYRSPPCSKQLLVCLHDWIPRPRSYLMREYGLNLEAGYILELLTRFESDCRREVRRLYNTSLIILSLGA